MLRQPKIDGALHGRPEPQWMSDLPRWHHYHFHIIFGQWAVIKKFHDYIWSQVRGSFLTYIKTTDKLDATGHRWVAGLANYEYTSTYRSGKKNIDVGALSLLLKLVILIMTLLRQCSAWAIAQHFFVFQHAPYSQNNPVIPMTTHFPHCSFIIELPSKSRIQSSPLLNLLFICNTNERISNHDTKLLKKLEEFIT